MLSELPINVLYVDDEISNLNSFKANFKGQFNLFIATNASEGIAILKEKTIHVLISDQRLSEKSGIEFLQCSKKITSKPIRIIISAFSDAEVLKSAINCVSIYKYLSKPFEIESIKDAINSAYLIYQQREEGFEIIKKLMKANEEISNALYQNKILNSLIIKSFDNPN